MKIARIEAHAYTVPVAIPLTGARLHLPFALVTIETDDGLVGTGLCGGMDHVRDAAAFVERKVAPMIIGQDPMNTERIWQTLLSRQNYRRFTGFWSSAVSAVDIALWDIKGKALGQPVARLLGGASEEVPAYITFGVSEYSREELVEVAKSLVADGHTRLKMVVGGLKHPSADGDEPEPAERSNRFLPRDIREDSARVHAVREAIGPDIELMIDANCKFTPAEALRLCDRIKDCDLTWFEEPVLGNDFRSLAHVRQSTNIPIAAGQNLGHIWAHRELIVNGAVDVAQPNVVHGGGYTECTKVAALARAYNLPIANGGAWPLHNLHLHAGVPNGGHVEFHWLAWQAGEAIFIDPPQSSGGWVSVPEKAGLGFDPRPAEELEEFLLKS